MWRGTGPSDCSYGCSDGGFRRSTGIPEDGYIAYETGYMNDGPFHGELAPMQASAGRRCGIGERSGIP